MNSKFFADFSDLERHTFTDGPLAGEFIMLRRRLSDAEEKALSYSVVKGFDEAGKAIVDLTGNDSRTIRAWVKRWSLGGNRERGSSVTDEELYHLLPEFASQILAAITDHTAALATEREALFDPKPESGSSPTASTTDSPPTSPPASPEPTD